MAGTTAATDQASDRAEHEELAVGDVDHAHHAEDQARPSAVSASTAAMTRPSRVASRRNGPKIQGRPAQNGCVV